jgi:hypothetical protein
MTETINWSLDQAYASGLMEMIPQPPSKPDKRWGHSLGARQRYLIHASLRMEDGTWKAFRWIDPVKAECYDKSLRGSML